MTDRLAPDAAGAFRERLDQSKRRVEAMLDALLAPPAGSGDASSARLVEAMRYSTLIGGKRLRPFLLVETARALGVGGDGPLRAGLSLIHI